MARHILTNISAQPGSLLLGNPTDRVNKGECIVVNSAEQNAESTAESSSLSHARMRVPTLCGAHHVIQSHIAHIWLRYAGYSHTSVCMCDCARPCLDATRRKARDTGTPKNGVIIAPEISA